MQWAHRGSLPFAGLASCAVGARACRTLLSQRTRACLRAVRQSPQETLELGVPAAEPKQGLDPAGLLGEPAGIRGMESIGAG